MLQESLTALAGAGGAAIVQAASTDAWRSFRDQVASWFGRGAGPGSELERLDRTAAELTAPGATEQTRLRQEAVWQTLIEQHLEGLAQAEQQRAASELRVLLEAVASNREASVHVGGIRVGDGSVGAAVIHGGVHISPPTPPAQSQG